MAENIQEVKIVDTVAEVVNLPNEPVTTHINKWSNGVFTSGMQGTESDDPRDVLSRLSSGDKNTEEIQAKRAADFERLVLERAQPKSG